MFESNVTFDEAWKKKKEKEDDVFKPVSNKRPIPSQAYVDVDQIFSEGFLDHIVTDFLKWGFSFALYSPSSQANRRLAMKLLIHNA